MIKLLLIIFLIGGGNCIVFSEKNPTSLSPKSSVTVTDADTKNIYKYDEPQRPTMGSPVFIFLRAIITLLIVVLLIYGTVYLLKLTWGKKPLLTPGAINVIDSFYLAQNKSIYIMDIAGTIYIIGVSEKGMDLLKEITDEVNINKIKSLLQERRTPSFKNYFSEFTKRFTGRGEEETSPIHIESVGTRTFEGIPNLRESINKLRTGK